MEGFSETNETDNQVEEIDIDETGGEASIDTQEELDEINSDKGFDREEASSEDFDDEIEEVDTEYDNGKTLVFEEEDDEENIEYIKDDTTDDKEMDDIEFSDERGENEFDECEDLENDEKEDNEIGFLDSENKEDFEEDESDLDNFEERGFNDNETNEEYDDNNDNEQNDDDKVGFFDGEVNDDVNESGSKTYEAKGDENETDEEIDKTNEEINKTNEGIAEAKEDENETGEEIDETNEEVDESDEEIGGTKEDKNETDEEIGETKEDENETDEENDEINEEVDENDEEIGETKEDKNEIDEEIDKTNEEVNKTDEEIGEIKEDENETDEENDEINEEVDENDEEIGETKEDKNETDEEIDKTNEEVNKIDETNEEVNESDEENDARKEAINESIEANDEEKVDKDNDGVDEIEDDENKTEGDADVTNHNTNDVEYDDQKAEENNEEKEEEENKQSAENADINAKEEKPQAETDTLNKSMNGIIGEESVEETGAEKETQELSENTQKTNHRFRDFLNTDNYKDGIYTGDYKPYGKTVYEVRHETYEKAKDTYSRHMRKYGAHEMDEPSRADIAMRIKDYGNILDNDLVQYKEKEEFNRKSTSEYEGDANASYAKYEKNSAAENMIRIESNRIENVNAADIKRYDSSREHFWEDHGRTKEQFLEIASHIPEVKERLSNGETLDSIKQDTKLESCVSSYFEKPIQVEKFENCYMFVDDGRHRIAAAAELGHDIPVTVVTDAKVRDTKLAGILEQDETNQKEPSIAQRGKDFFSKILGRTDSGDTVKTDVRESGLFHNIDNNEDEKQEPESIENGELELCEYNQGNNIYGYEGTSTMATGSNILNTLTGKMDYSENKLVCDAVENGQCKIDGIPEENGSSTMNDLEAIINAQKESGINTEMYSGNEKISVEDLSEKLKDDNKVAAVAVDSTILWEAPNNGLFKHNGTDNCIMVNKPDYDENGNLKGFQIVDVVGGERYVEINRFRAMYEGDGQNGSYDSTTLIVNYDKEVSDSETYDAEQNENPEKELEKLDMCEYEQGQNSYGYESTCGPTSGANALNILNGEKKYTEQGMLDKAVSKDLCNTEGVLSECGGTNTVTLDKLINEAAEPEDKISTEVYEYEDAPSIEMLAVRIDNDDTVAIVGVDSNGLWGQYKDETCYWNTSIEHQSDHWIVVNKPCYDDDGNLRGFQVVDSGGGESYVDKDKFEKIYIGSEFRKISDPTAIFIHKDK